MKYLGAYMLLSLSGETEIKKEDVAALLKGEEIEVDDAALDLMMSKVEGKNILELIAEGKERLLTIGGGGGAGAAAGGAAGAAAEEAVEEEAEEEEEIDVGGGGLFGGGDEAAGY